jgi:hypothetical protein
VFVRNPQHLAVHISGEGKRSYWDPNIMKDVLWLVVKQNNGFQIQCCYAYPAKISEVLQCQVYEWFGRRHEEPNL